MRENLNKVAMKAIAEVTGLKNGAELRCLTGSAIATAIVGRVPSKTDRAMYLGTSKERLDANIHAGIKEAWDNGCLRDWYGVHLLMRPSQTQLLYSLATQLIANGIVTADEKGEPTSHRLAREFLNGHFYPQDIISAAEFQGYNMVLEYLWLYAEQEDNYTSFTRFVGYRYDNLPCSRATAFCNLVGEHTKSSRCGMVGICEELLLTGDYRSVIDGLRLELVSRLKSLDDRRSRAECLTA